MAEGEKLRSYAEIKKNKCDVKLLPKCWYSFLLAISFLTPDLELYEEHTNVFKMLIFINLFIIYSQIQSNLDYSNKLISLTRYNLHKSSSSTPSFKQIIEVLCATRHFFIYRAGVDQHQSYVNTSCNQCFRNRTPSWTFCCLFVTLSPSSKHLSFLRTYTADCQLPWRNSEKRQR